jgi:hypothetical protein
VRRVRRSVYCTASFSVCSRRRTEFQSSTQIFASTTNLQHCRLFLRRSRGRARLDAPEGVACFAGELSEEEQKLVWATHAAPAAKRDNWHSGSRRSYPQQACLMSFGAGKPNQLHLELGQLHFGLQDLAVKGNFTACWNTARDYVLERKQFTVPKANTRRPSLFTSGRWRYQVAGFFFVDPAFLVQPGQSLGDF